MKRIIHFTGYLYLLLSFMQLNAQSGNEHQCGSDHAENILLQDPAYAQTVLEQESLYRKRMKEKARNGNQNNLMPIQSIPVIIHVIHSGESYGSTYNPSDASLIGPFIDASNRFRHQHFNAGTYSNPNYGVDTEIDLCLASVDPNGNYTNGIVRHYDPEIAQGSYTGANNIVTQAKAQYGWDTNLYCNIFIFQSIYSNFNPCSNIAGVYLGGSTDVTIFKATSYNSGLIAHELGHYFNLRHTFNGNSCTNTDCLANGDFVCDTPAKNVSGSNGGTCSAPNNTCTTDEDDTSANNPYRAIALGGLGEQPDNINNYMDYTGSCWDMFTLGQKNRMQDYIANNRAALAANGAACAPMPPPTYDLGPTAITISNKEDACDDTFDLSLFFSNFGTGTVSSFDLIVEDQNGNLIKTENWSGNLNATNSTGISTTVTIDDQVTYLKAYAVILDGNGDEHLFNDAVFIKATYLGGTSPCYSANESCNGYNPATESGPGNTTIYTITDTYPATSGNVEICIEVKGDVNRAFETFNIIDENGTLRGNSGFREEPGCAQFIPPTPFCFIATSADYDSWRVDGAITVTLDPVSTCINPTLSSNNCTVINEGCVNVRLPNATCEPPVALCNDITVSLDDAGNYTLMATAIDNGSTADCGIQSITASQTDFDCSEIGINNITLEITDLESNTSTCVAQVIIEDATPPTAGCTSTAVSLDANGEGIITPDIVNFGSSDNCDGDLEFELDQSIVTCDNLSNFPVVTLTVSDAAGNSSTCTSIINVFDNMPPTTSCLPTTVPLDLNGNANITADMVANYNDNCFISAELNTTNFTCDNVGGNFVSVIFSNTTGPIGSCGALVTVTDPTGVCGCQDLEAPIAICNDLVIALDENGIASITPDEVNNNSTDDCGITSLSINISDFDCNAVGIQAVILTVEDSADNTSTCQSVVTIEDNIFPELIGVPEDLTLECGGSVFPTLVTATDNCGNDLEVTTTFEVDQAVDCPIFNTQTTIYSVTDDAGNTTTQQRVITVLDTEAPILFGVPVDITIQCGDQIPAPAEVTAFECTQLFDLSLQENNIEDCTNGSLIRIWTVADDCGNETNATQVITVVDTEAPVFVTLPDDITLACGEELIIDMPTVADNCSADLTPTFEDSNINATTIERLWTLVDACGNSTNYLQTITNEIDNTAPVLQNVPDDVTLECGGTIPQPPSIAIDNCDGAISVDVQDEIIQGECPISLIINRTYSATDLSGNTTSILHVVTIVDNTAPTLSGVPADVTINCDDSLPAIPDVVGLDGCSQVEIFFIEIELDDCANSVRRSWTGTDGCGNEHTEFQIITIIDDEAPIFTSVPADVTLLCDDEATVDPPVAEDCSTISVPAFQDVVINATTTERTWTVTDVCGNSITHLQTITTATSNTPPVLVGVPEDLTLECGDTVFPSTVTATDNCGNDLEVTITFDNDQSAECPIFSINTTFYTATDAEGNTTTEQSVITVFDNAPPIFGGVPEDVTIQCGQDIPAIPEVFAFDCADLTEVIYTESPLDGDCTGQSIVRTWSSTDDCGNEAIVTQTISVTDDEAPIFTSTPNDVTLLCGDETTVDPPVAEDCSTISVPAFQDVVVNATTIERTWTVSDVCGNTTSYLQIITTDIDNESPMIVGVPDDITIDCGGIIPPPDVSANDNCDGNVEVVFSQEFEEVSCPIVLRNIRIYTATDISGNSSVVQQVITVIDNDAPTLENVPADVTIQCGQDIPDAADVTASDTCPGDIEISLAETPIEGDCTGSSFVRTWTAIDVCGNETTGTQVITVIDEEAPLFSTTPEDQNVDCGNVPDAPSITAADNCDSNLLIEFDESSTSNNDVNTITRTWTATDDCGNETIVIQIITEDCSSDDEIIVDCPEDILVSCDLSGTHVSWNEPTATSTCSAGTTCDISVPDYIDMGIFNGHRYFCSQSNSLSWSQARQTATAYGGYLVVINDAAENEFIRDAIIAPTCWIGLTDEVSEGNFIWEGNQSSNYSNWLSGEPNNQDSYYPNAADHVALIKGDGKWRDRDDKHHYEFIIEVPCDESGLTITQTSGPENGGEFQEGTTTVSYEFTDACGGIATCSFDVTVDTCPEADYCDIWGNSYYEYIDNVTMSGFSNWSGNNWGYADFTNLSSDVYTNCVHYIYLKPGYKWNAYLSYWKVWIDWNQDGDFYDAGEMVKACTNSYGQWYGIHVPGHALPGDTRMRVAMRYGGWPQPCGSLGYGEAEDYTIHVNTSAPLVAPEELNELQVSKPLDDNEFTEYYNERDEDGNFVRVTSYEAVDLFPNPASDQITIVLNKFETEEGVYEIYHSTGVLMETINNVSTNIPTVVNTSKYESGVYTVLLKVNGQVKKSKPFVKISDK